MGKALTMDSRVSCGHNPAGFVQAQRRRNWRWAAAGAGPVERHDHRSRLRVPETGRHTLCNRRERHQRQSVKLLVSGAAVLLDSLAGSTNGTINGQVGALTLVSVQGKVTAR